jgi:hypothetical protein
MLRVVMVSFPQRGPPWYHSGTAAVGTDTV